MELKYGQVYKFEVEGWEDDVIGVYLDKSTDWIMTINIPNDFMVDGHSIINKKFINNYYRSEEEVFVERVLFSKGLSYSDKPLFELRGFYEQFVEIQKKEVCIEILEEDSEISYIGRILEVFEDSFDMQHVGTRGSWMEIVTHSMLEIRAINFNTDYINSLTSYRRMIKTDPTFDSDEI